MVELVGLEPATRVLWNVGGVSDQLTLSDTRQSSSKRAAIDGNFYKREIFGCRHAGMESPRCSPDHGSLLPPGQHHHRALGSPDRWAALRSELLSFNAGKHDDIVDALGLIGQLLDTCNRDGRHKAGILR